MFIIYDLGSAIATYLSLLRTFAPSHLRLFAPSPDQLTDRPTDRPTMHADQDEELARVSDLERVDPPSGSTTIPLQQRSCWAFSPADEVKASNLEFGFHFRYLSAFQDSAHLGLFMTFIHRLVCVSVLLAHFLAPMWYSLHKFCPISIKFGWHYSHFKCLLVNAHL